MTSNPLKIIVAGADGQLGTEFRALQHIYPDLAFDFLSRTDLDIALESRVMAKISNDAPAAVINCAAYTNVERAQDEKENAFIINAHSAGYLAKACDEANALLIHFSTDYVFDGKKNSPYIESDEVNPLSVYGESKLEGERLIESFCKRNFVLRTSWLYSTHGHNFYKTMVRLAGEKGALQVVNDQTASPTYARHLAHDVLELLDLVVVQTKQVDYGLYHYSQGGQASWYDFAKEIVINKKLAVPVLPIKTEQTHTKAMRPVFSKLNATKFTKATNITPPSWKEGLSACVYNDYIENEYNH